VLRALRRDVERVFNADARIRIGERGNSRGTNDRQQLAESAIRKGGRIIAEYLEPGHRPGVAGTLARLVAVTDTQELAAAVDRMEKGFGLNVIKQFL
jgi:hypothetical protein